MAEAETEALYLTDAYRDAFDSRVLAVDVEGGAVCLAATAFFPTGGGQPSDRGTLSIGDDTLTVTDVRKDGGGRIWHAVGAERLPAVGAEATGHVDFDRRHRLMRMHTALHILNGLIWIDYGARVTGANMTTEEGRLDFELPSMSQEFGREMDAGSTSKSVAIFRSRSCSCPVMKPITTPR